MFPPHLKILLTFKGTVACLEAHGRNYLFSASDDNSLAITKVGSWQVNRVDLLIVKERILEVIV